jgi:CRISPR-associated protein Cmr1
VKRIEIDLEAVTATFLHVEPDGPAVWRAAPFRGIARWWFRAVRGAALGGDTTTLRKDEEATFGTASSPSPVVFRVLNGRGELYQAPLNPGANSPGREAPKKALRPGATATLELVPAPWCSETDRLRQAYAAVWIALHLGGVGQRARRGAGSLRMVGVRTTDVPGEDLLPRPIQTTDLDGHARELAEGVKAVQAILGAPVTLSEPAYPMLHPGHSCVTVSKGISGDEKTVRARLMNQRRAAPGHRGRARETEFGGIGPRLSSPTWVRVAPGGLFVTTIFRYRAPGAANWSNAEAFVRSLGEGRDVFGARAS